MTFLRIFPVLYFCMLCWGFPSLERQKVVPAKDSLKKFYKNYLPKSKFKEQTVKHTAFALCYDEAYEQAKWVAYKLTAEMCIDNSEERTDNFRADKDIFTGSAIPDDYKKSGYDRGHLCPAGDMAWSEITMSESFYMSNMSPQEPKFNRGIWKTLESDVREWAKSNEEIFVVTAGVLQPGLETIGTVNKVAVPKYYYKVILDVKGPEQKAIAFVLPNAGSKESVFEYAVSIDSVEKLTSIDFFPALPDGLENNLESHFNVELWNLR